MGEGRVMAESLRALVVEDDADDYLLTEMLLREVPGLVCLSVEWASTYAEGLLRARDAYDVILVDYRLGAADGVAFVRAAIADGVTTPLILLTGQAGREVALDALGAGASDYLVKGGLSVESLERSVRYAIQRTRAARALRESEARFRAALDGMLDAFFILHPVYDAGGAPTDYECIDANVAGAALLGTALDDLLGLRFGELMPIGRTSGICDILDRVLATGVRHEGEYESQDPRTAAAWLRLQVVRTPDGLAVTARDISEQKRADQALSDLVVRDELSGLLNRRGFWQLVPREVKVAHRERRADALLCLDLNGFKAINDTYGHAEGDRALQTVARVLTAVLRESDVVARLGGDEFVVYAPGREVEGGQVVALRIWAAFEAENLAAAAAGRPYAIRTGIGVAQLSPDDDLQTLLARADAALYANKLARVAALGSATP